MVRKEVVMHLLVYNLIRGIKAEAARVAEIKPRTISFTGSRHTIRAFEQSHLYAPARILADLPILLKLISTKRVGARPDSYESRAVRRRPKPHPLQKMPRKAAQRSINRSIIFYGNR